MTIQELKQKLEVIKWLDKEIQGLQLEMQYLDEHRQEYKLAG